MSGTGSGGASRWSASDGVRRGHRYDERWRELAAAGAAIHGEADFVMRFAPGSVLDAGCGTGRVAIELAARGVDVVGVDVDAHMLDAARDKAPDLEWHHADLLDVDLASTFDLVVLAGNVMIFLAPGTEADVVANLAGHLEPDGHLVAGFQLGHGYDLGDFDRHAADAGLALVERWATWDAEEWTPGGDYVVSVHRPIA